MRVGIIGTGNMGGMLTSLFATIPKLTVRAYNRSPEKMLTLAKHYETIELAGSLSEITRTCHVVFLCTKANDGREILQEYGRSLTPSQVLATTISGIPLKELERVTQAQVVKVIPSITQTVRSGVCLISYGTRFDTVQADAFEDLVRDISTPFVVEEAQIRIASDLTSCGPAFLSYLLLNWATAASETDMLSRAEAEHLLCQTFIGLANLLRHGVSLHEVLQRVCIPGGVTQAGIEALAPDVHRLFHTMHAATMAHAAPSKAPSFQSPAHLS